MSRAAYLVHELQELGRQQQQEEQATSLLQRFVGSLGHAPSRETHEPSSSAYTEPGAQATRAAGDPPSWLKGLLDALASKFGATDTAPSSSSLKSSVANHAAQKIGSTPSSAGNSMPTAQESQELLQLRQELEALKEEKARREKQAEKERLQSEIKSLRESMPELPLEQASAEEPGESNTVLDWLPVDVEQWDLENVLITTAQQKMWISGVRPAIAKGWTRTPVAVSAWLAAEKLRLSDEDLNVALQKAGLQKATVLNRDLLTLRLLVKVLSPQDVPE